LHYKGVGDAREIKTIGGAGVGGGRAEAADGVEAVDVEALVHEAFGGVDSEDLADDEVVFADAFELVEGAFEADVGLGHAGHADGEAGGGMEAGGVEFVVALGEIGGGDVHGLDEVFGDEVDDEFAGGGDVAGGVLGAAVFEVAHADDEDGGEGAIGVITTIIKPN